ncbi:hypothetical protein BKA64DRAFT_648804 [Cadophora sp. MPI-SDFR-AT-0126]|nr:hypothetical protein BKA64DRAFT_648804 [Leotiomycetes sp. MPI-SDFR-AT-0126]
MKAFAIATALLLSCPTLILADGHNYCACQEKTDSSNLPVAATTTCCIRNGDGAAMEHREADWNHTPPGIPFTGEYCGSQPGASGQKPKLIDGDKFNSCCRSVLGNKADSACSKI